MKITSLVELKYFLLEQKYKLEIRIKEVPTKSVHRDCMIADMVIKDFIDFLLEQIEIKECTK